MLERGSFRSADEIAVVGNKIARRQHVGLPSARYFAAANDRG